MGFASTIASFIEANVDFLNPGHRPASTIFVLKHDHDVAGHEIILLGCEIVQMSDLGNQLFAKTTPMIVQGLHDKGVPGEKAPFGFLWERGELRELRAREEIVRSEWTIVAGVNSDGVDEWAAVHGRFYS